MIALNKIDLFNSESICIFTDSSFKKYKNIAPHEAIGITAPAFCVYQNDNLIEQGFDIMYSSTSQQGELHALLLGVMASYKYRNFPHIRIFSDSQNSVHSVREFIFKWVRDTSNGRSALGPNGRISNQEYIMDVVYTIIANNIYLELYHIKGHVNIKNRNSVLEAKELFQRSNPWVGPVEDGLIFQLAMGNNVVDEYSTVMLRSHMNDPEYDTRALMKAVEIGYAPFDMHNYISLVNKGGIRRSFSKSPNERSDEFNE